jgi:hypothetical protein
MFEPCLVLLALGTEIDLQEINLMIMDHANEICKRPRRMRTEHQGRGQIEKFIQPAAEGSDRAATGGQFGAAGEGVSADAVSEDAVSEDAITEGFH